MARTRYKPEEIVAKLRQVDVLVSQGQSKEMPRPGDGTTTRLVLRWLSTDFRRRNVPVSKDYASRNRVLWLRGPRQTGPGLV